MIWVQCHITGDHTQLGRNLSRCHTRRPDGFRSHSDVYVHVFVADLAWARAALFMNGNHVHFSNLLTDAKMDGLSPSV